MFALARYGGLRIPHEGLALRWTDIDWENRRVRIPGDTKTGGRVLPLFPEAFKEVDALWDQAPDGAEWLLDRARRSAGTTWRDWLITAIDCAKVTQWEKLWANLRASCRTYGRGSLPAGYA